ncbi:MAG: hypothetical protein HY000_07085, partial [Planctomycetes bacterium]|nr:hypothetical protein [Planctomycetota bacterium]
PQTAAGRADYLAQLAVNIVDFRDADSIMTGFEYDRFPGDDTNGDGNGWDVDGDLTTNEGAHRGVVWGFERPHIVINETLAYYDTRMDANGMPGGPEEYYLAVELHNVDDPNHPGYVDHDTDLDATDLATGTSEVWRLAIAQQSTSLVPSPMAEDPPANAAVVIFRNQQSSLPFNVAAYYADPSMPTSSFRINRAPSAPPDQSPYYVLSGPRAPNLPLSIPARHIANHQNGVAVADWGSVIGAGIFPRLGAYLQRLADPTRAWDAAANPYVTVDALDIKVYTLSSNNDPGPDGQLGTPDDMFETLGSYERLQPYVGRNRGLDHPNTGPGSGSYSAHSMPSSLPSLLPPPQYTNDNVDRNDNSTGTPPGDGLPDLAFPWLVHLDRPLASPMELLHVTAYRPGRLTNEFLADPAMLFTADPYRPLANASLALTDPMRPPDVFPHLLQFFEDERQLRQPNGVPQAGSAFAHARPGIYRLLEFVDVDSRMNGAAELLNPSIFTPPYHYRRARRVPGKINVNTIYEPEVFAALFNDHPDVNPQNPTSLWQYFNPAPGNPSELRRGGPQSDRDPVTNAYSWGTDDDRPFRSFAFGQPLGDIDDTLLRSIRPSANGQPADVNPLLDHAAPLPSQQAPSDPLPQHSALRYQLYQKLGNTATTRSNVFAIWVTVGFFEVLDEPQPDTKDNDGDNFIDEPDELLPKLGREVGSDTGQVKRHRGFYVIDRSRPVGYHSDVAIDDSGMILLRHVIE